MGTIRAAVIGLGHMGTLHAKTLAQHPGYELVAVYDVDSQKCSAAGKLVNTSCASPAEIIAQKIDLVTVATFTGTHSTAAQPFLDARIPALTEKPIDDTLAHAQELERCAKKNATPLFVSFTEYFHPSVALVKQFIDGKKIGAVKEVRITRTRPELEPGRYVGSDALNDCLVHDAYNLLHWFNLPVKLVEGDVVLEKRGNRAIPFEDYSHGRVVVDGLPITFDVSWVADRKQRRTEIVGTNGRITIDYLANTMIVNGKEQAFTVDKKDNLTRVYDAVADHLRNKKPYPIRFDLALRSMELCTRITKLAKPY